MRGLAAAVPAVLLVAAVSACTPMEQVSDGAYRNAVRTGTVHELGARGIKLHGRPVCRTPETATKAVARVHCTARTRAGEPVAVEGTAHRADTVRPRESYVVTVGGREVLRQDCLGAGCRRPGQ